MSLLTCEEDISLGDLARRYEVNLHHFWLPLSATLPPRASKTTCVTVDATTPLAMLDHATQELSFDKRHICARMLVSNAHRCEEEAVSLDPVSVPAGCTVFVRSEHRATKRVRAATQILYYEVDKEAAPRRPQPAASSLSSQSSISGTGGVKRSRHEEGSSVTAASLADTLRGKQNRLSLQQRSSEDLQRRLAAALQTRPRPLNPRSLHVLATTAANIRQRVNQPPLHFVLPAQAEFLEAGGVRWTRANRRILSRVFRGSSSEERSEASKYSDGSRQVRFYFIEDVLLRRQRLWESNSQAAKAEGQTMRGGTAEMASEQKEEEKSENRENVPAEAATATQTTETGTPAEATFPAVASSNVEMLLKDALLADMNSHAERGHRIVFLEHYPILHHASRFTVEKTLEPVVRLCQTCCPHLTVTVVLSAMSYVTATRRQGMELSLVMPQVGLLQFFVAEMNTSLQPDPKLSSVVGSDARSSDFLRALHRDFARHASLPYVEASKIH